MKRTAGHHGRRDWAIARCASGSCIHLHIERFVLTLSPSETVALAKLLQRAVDEYDLDGEPIAPTTATH